MGGLWNNEDVFGVEGGKHVVPSRGKYALPLFVGTEGDEVRFEGECEGLGLGCMGVAGRGWGGH